MSAWNGKGVDVGGRGPSRHRGARRGLWVLRRARRHAAASGSKQQHAAQAATSNNKRRYVATGSCDAQRPAATSGSKRQPAATSSNQRQRAATGSCDARRQAETSGKLHGSTDKPRPTLDKSKVPTCQAVSSKPCFETPPNGAQQGETVSKMEPKYGPKGCPPNDQIGGPKVTKMDPQNVPQKGPKMTPQEGPKRGPKTSPLDPRTLDTCSHSGRFWKIRRDPAAEESEFAPPENPPRGDKLPMQ